MLITSEKAPRHQQVTCIGIVNSAVPSKTEAIIEVDPPSTSPLRDLPLVHSVPRIHQCAFGSICILENYLEKQSYFYTEVLKFDNTLTNRNRPFTLFSEIVSYSEAQ